MDYILIFLIFSLILNLSLVYYAVVVAKRLYLAGTNLEALQSMIEEFMSHLENVHEMEMFYGDATLGSLMTHSKDLLEELETYRDIMDVVVEEEQDFAEETEKE